MASLSHCWEFFTRSTTVRAAAIAVLVCAAAALFAPTSRCSAQEADSPVVTEAPAGKQATSGKTDAIPPATDVAAEAAAAGTTSRNLTRLAVVLALIIVPMILGNWLSNRLRMPDYGWRFALGIGSLLAAAVVVSTGEIKLGPDLSGGITLIYELADASQVVDEATVDAAQAEGKAGADAKSAEDGEIDDAGGFGAFSGDDMMSALVKALVERVDPSGTKEVTIRKYGAREVEITIPKADKQDLEYIERRIYTAGALEFRITASERFAKHRNFIELARRLPPGENFVRTEDGEAVARWVEYSPDEFGSAEEAAARGLVTRLAGKTPQALVMVNDGLNVTGKFLRSATPDVDETGRPQVSFVFNERGAQLFGRLTGTHLPNPSGERYNLGILLDNRLLNAPTIESKITDRGRISGGTMNEKEVEFIVGILNAGSLPAALNKDPISRAQISPTLGKETVRRGKLALGISLVVVAIFMLFYYRTAGVIAVIGLAANMLLILGVMVLIKGAFTLPGLAGLVLTVGMSVDANVLINERIRDELKRGAALRMAIRNGFTRAWVTIFDSNVTNLIVAVVIYKIAPDNVKGFGVTLFIGILMSVYSAVFLTRIIFDVAERKGWLTELKMRQFIGETNFDFISWGKVWIGLSLATIAIGLAAAAARKSDLFDIDFTGGSSVSFVLSEEMSFAEVLARLEETPLGDKNLSLVELGDSQTQYSVTTINDDVRAVEAILQSALGDKLKTYRVEIRDLQPVTAAAWRARLHMLAAAPVLAMAPVNLLQAEGSDATVDAPPPDDEATANGDDVGQEAGAPNDESSPASDEAAAADGKSATESAESPKSAAAATGSSVEADEVANPFAGGAQATIVFSVKGEEGDAAGVNYTAVVELVDNALAATGNEGIAHSVSNPDHQAGSIRNFREWLVKLALPPEKAQAVFDKVKATIDGKPVFPLSNKIGSRVAGRMAGDAIAATILCLVGITAYIWFRFHRAVYGFAAVIALVHDVLVAIGFVAISSYFVSFSQPLAEMLLVDKFQIGLTLVAAFLTIIGYSLNDTIVIFDRIREVKGKSPHLTRKMINDSVNQTLARTLLTSFTTLMTITVLYIFAGEGIHGFAFAMLIGIVAGSYSTIFIANPILLWMAERADATTRPKAGSQAA